MIGTFLEILIQRGEGCVAGISCEMASSASHLASRSISAPQSFCRQASFPPCAAEFRLIA